MDSINLLDFGSKYDTPNTAIRTVSQGSSNSLAWDCPYGYGNYVIEKEVWVPPSPGTKGQPYIPPTPAQIKYIENTGWNTWARSVDAFSPGQCFDFSCATGVSGCCIGVGPSAKIGAKISSFAHSLVVDRSGVSVREDSTKKTVLTSAQVAATSIRVYFQADRKIIYTVVTGTETLMYVSAAKYTSPNAYIFGYLYSSGDRILAAEYKSGKVQYGSV